jgi:hypothetical protein
VKVTPASLERHRNRCVESGGFVGRQAKDKGTKDMDTVFFPVCNRFAKD